MGLRNLVKGKYYCAQDHVHSNNSEVDKCNEVYKLKIKQENEKEVQLARFKAEERKEEERTKQAKYFAEAAEAARDFNIAQMKAGNNNALPFTSQAQSVGSNAMALPWHDTNDTRPKRKITTSLAGSASNTSSRPYAHSRSNLTLSRPPSIAQQHSTQNPFQNSSKPSTSSGHRIGIYSGSDSYHSARQSQAPTSRLDGLRRNHRDVGSRLGSRLGNSDSRRNRLVYSSQNPFQNSSKPSTSSGHRVGIYSGSDSYHSAQQSQAPTSRLGGLRRNHRDVGSRLGSRLGNSDSRRNSLVYSSQNPFQNSGSDSYHSYQQSQEPTSPLDGLRRNNRDVGSRLGARLRNSDNRRNNPQTLGSIKALPWYGDLR